MSADGSSKGDTTLPTAPQPEIDSGTGWPGESAADPWASPRSETVALPVRTTTIEDDRPAPVEERRRRSGLLGRLGLRAFWLAVIAGLIVVVLLSTNLFGLWHFSNPFSARKIDRSQPTLLLSIQDLARFEAASGNFQVIIDVQEDRRFIPDIIFNERSLFVAAGSVDAYVDFSHLGPGDVVPTADRKGVVIHLPAPGLESPNLDVSKSYVYSESRGLVNRIGDIFGGDPNKQRELYQLAQQKIAAAAVDSQLPQRAADNTKQMLTQLLKSLGYTTIDVEFASS